MRIFEDNDSLSSLDPYPPAHILSNQQLEERLAQDFGWTDESRTAHVKRIQRFLNISNDDIRGCDDQESHNTTFTEEKIEDFDEESQRLIRANFL